MELKQSYRDLIVWQKGMVVVKLTYETTAHFPVDERFGLVTQMRRSAVSIVSNIAEGRYRRSQKDFCNFLSIAFASGAELETQVEVARMLGLMDDKRAEEVLSVLTEVMKMLNKMIATMRS